jgi:O-antigen ligase
MSTRLVTPVRIITAVILSSCFVWSVAMVSNGDLWPVAAAQTFIYILGASVALWLLVVKILLPCRWLMFPFTIIPIVGLAQLYLGSSAYQFATWYAVLTFGSLAIALVLGLFVFQSKQITTVFQVGLVLFGAALAVLALCQRAFAAERIFFVFGPGHAMGTFVNRDHYSALMELLLPIAIWTAMARRQNMLVFGGIAAVMYASVVAGASRAGVLITTLELGVIIVFTLIRHRAAGLRPPMRTVLTLACLVLVLSSAAGWRVVLERFGAGNPLAYRKDFWEASIRMIKDSPLIGYGMGSWRWVYPRYEIVDAGAIVRHAHNDYLEWTSDGGLFLLAAFLLIAMHSARLGWLYPWALGPSMVFLHSLVDFPLQEYPIALALALILAAAESCRLHERRWREETEASPAVEAGLLTLLPST